MRARVGTSGHRFRRQARAFATRSGRGNDAAHLLLGAGLEQLFRVVDHDRELHGFVGPGQAAYVQPAQAVVGQQVAKDGLDGAPPQAPVAVPAPTVLPLPSPIIGRIRWLS